LAHDLEGFFDPSTIAVVGASREQGKIGNDVLKNIIEAGYEGKIFPINPKADEILGLKTYHSLSEVPMPVDLAVIIVPSDFVPNTMEQCASNGVTRVVIISGGFRESGEDGKLLEKKVAEIAANAGIRVIGPNSQGINNPHHRLCATFGGFAKKTGSIAVVSQSGTISAAVQCWADREGVGVSKCVNLGNKIDVNEVDLLQYLGDDDQSKVIALYIEGLTDGRLFMNIAREVSKTKPIVVLKGGTSGASLRAMASHTGSLAGNIEIFRAAMKQSKIIEANSVEELYDIAKAFSLLPLPKGPGTLIIESTGGAGILASSTCEQLGLKLPELNEGSQNRLKRQLSSVCTFSNPFDLTTEGFNPDKFRIVIEESITDDRFQAILAIFGDPIPNAAEAMRNIAAKSEKPVLVCYLGGGETELLEKAKMHSFGIPVFPSPERAVVALNALVKYSMNKSDI
jgi:acetyl coenzyme A synthetase (ADP forming)-like protein